MGAIGAPYASLIEMKQYQKLTGPNLTNTSNDAGIEMALDAASRQVEQYCGRQFNKQDFATPREFEVTGSRIATDDFWTSDLFSIEQVAAYDVVQGEAFTDAYNLYPRNGVVDGSPGWPYYGVEFGPYQPIHFLRGQYVSVTAKWGWAAVPPTVKQATLIIANQLLRLSDAPLGVTGMEGQSGGMIRVRDIPQVASLLNRFVSTPIMIG